MDKKEYLLRQLAKTDKKNYEAYIVSRIIHRLDDLAVKAVTQQHVVSGSDPTKAQAGPPKPQGAYPSNQS